MNINLLRHTPLAFWSLTSGLLALLLLGGAVLGAAATQTEPATIVVQDADLRGRAAHARLAQARTKADVREWASRYSELVDEPLVTALLQAAQGEGPVTDQLDEAIAAVRAALPPIFPNRSARS